MPSSDPSPYRGPQSPFPLPVGKRSLGGWAALSESRGTDALVEMFGKFGRPQPAPLGKTRCYWALLNSHSTPSNPYDLTFLYCDPVLQSHMGSEADQLVGKSFFEWVHPAEKERAKSDLQAIVSSRTLFGSVTRCRYTRVPAMRKVFGNPNPEIAPESHMYVDDDFYLPIDVVLNMVGDSIALCFFHAIINKSVRDNDEVSKTDWTNWCGTGRELFDAEQCNMIWSCVQSAKLLKRPSSPQPCPPYVFQILTMPPNEEMPEVLFSWPPPRLYRTEAQQGSQRDQHSFHEAFGDGSYFADEFARLAQGVRASPSARTEDGSAARNGDPGTIQDGANTSCTRRFRAQHTLTSEGMLRSIETVLVPYGSIMFACFGTMYQQVINQPSQGQQSLAELQWPQESPFAGTPIAATPQDLNSELTQPARKRVKDGLTNPFPSHVRSSNLEPHFADAIAPRLPTNPPEVLYTHPSSRATSVSCATTYSNADSPSTSSGNDGSSPSQARYGVLPDGSTDDVRNRHISPAASANSSGTEGSRFKNDVVNERPPGSSSAVAAALFAETHPETGEKRCTSCGTSNSPEWRKGPSGQKTLCNACGLRFSRSISRQQKKTEKARQQAGISAKSQISQQTAEHGKTSRPAERAREFPPSDALSTDSTHFNAIHFDQNRPGLPQTSVLSLSHPASSHPHGPLGADLYGRGAVPYDPRAPRSFAATPADHTLYGASQSSSSSSGSTGSSRPTQFPHHQHPSNLQYRHPPR